MNTNVIRNYLGQKVNLALLHSYSVLHTRSRCSLFKDLSALTEAHLLSAVIIASFHKDFRPCCLRYLWISTWIIRQIANASLDLLSVGSVPRLG